ncbi:MAG: HEAT repeat domain-containing protein [Candidatus Methylomirabilales bacterium]
MIRRYQDGQANLTATLLLVGLIVAVVWIWKRLPPDTQDFLVERAIPLTLLGVAVALFVWVAGRKLHRRRKDRVERDRLMLRFEREPSPEKRLDLAFEIIELNRYKPEGLERVAPAMAELFVTTMKTALGDKQHRVRGMAASHLGVLGDKTTVPLLLAALEDDHAYVRASAALALGRMRASEAKAKLESVMREDWDQTVRSRAREALERLT